VIGAPSRVTQQQWNNLPERYQWLRDWAVVQSLSWQHARAVSGCCRTEFIPFGTE
jgi:hypothetical protein